MQAPSLSPASPSQASRILKSNGNLLEQDRIEHISSVTRFSANFKLPECYGMFPLSIEAIREAVLSGYFNAGLHITESGQLGIMVYNAGGRMGTNSYTVPEFSYVARVSCANHAKRVAQIDRVLTSLRISRLEGEARDQVMTLLEAHFNESQVYDPIEAQNTAEAVQYFEKRGVDEKWLQHAIEAAIPMQGFVAMVSMDILSFEREHAQAKSLARQFVVTTVGIPVHYLVGLIPEGPIDMAEIESFRTCRN